MDLGKERGFLTANEIRQGLPRQLASPEEIDGVMSMLGELDIDVVESAEGENEVKEIIFSVPLALQYVVVLSQRLKEGGLSPSEALGGMRKVEIPTRSPKCRTIGIDRGATPS